MDRFGKNLAIHLNECRWPRIGCGLLLSPATMQVVTSINIDFQYKLIDWFIHCYRFTIDYYQKRRQSFGRGSTLTRCLGHSKTTKICVHSDITVFAEPSRTPYAKRWQRSGRVQCPCIFRIELDSNVSEIARKEMKDTLSRWRRIDWACKDLLKPIIILSKYFPDSNWLKAHAEIHHNQLLKTKFGRILRLMNR